MAAKLQPLLARNRYSDEEWAMASAGQCDWMTANYPGITYCLKASDPDSFYRWCPEHDQEARENGRPGDYGR